MTFHWTLKSNSKHKWPKMTLFSGWRSDSILRQYSNTRGQLSLLWTQSQFKERVDFSFGSRLVRQGLYRPVRGPLVGRIFEKTLKSAKDILTHILQTEEEIKLFCEANNINTKNQHIFTLGNFFKICQNFFLFELWILWNLESYRWYIFENHKSHWIIHFVNEENPICPSTECLLCNRWRCSAFSRTITNSWC